MCHGGSQSFTLFLSTYCVQALQGAGAGWQQASSQKLCVILRAGGPLEGLSDTCRRSWGQGGGTARRLGGSCPGLAAAVGRDEGVGWGCWAC